MAFSIKLNTDYLEPKVVENSDDRCDFDHNASDGKYCPFKVHAADVCSPEKTNHQYGFPERRPCIFLKLNKVSLEIGELSLYL